MRHGIAQSKNVFLRYTEAQQRSGRANRRPPIRRLPPVCGIFYDPARIPFSGVYRTVCARYGHRGVPGFARRTSRKFPAGLELAVRIEKFDPRAARVRQQNLATLVNTKTKWAKPIALCGDVKPANEISLGEKYLHLARMRIRDVDAAAVIYGNGRRTAGLIVIKGEQRQPARLNFSMDPVPRSAR